MYSSILKIVLLQFESAVTGREQFMYRAGLLSEETNVIWDLDFKGYHGLRSPNEILRISTDKMFRKSLKTHEVDHCNALMKHISPLIREPICYQLISLIMLLDTSNLIEDCVTPLDAICVPSNRIQPCEVNTPSLLDVYDDDGFSWPDVYETIAAGDKSSVTYGKKRPSVRQRFKEIKELQKYYIDLLRKRCMGLNNPKIRRLGDTDVGLKGTMLCLKQLAQYEPIKIFAQDTYNSQ